MTMLLSCRWIVSISITFLLATSCIGKSEKIINAGDYGISQYTDAVPAIRVALEACREQQAVKLIIPKGRYDFYPERCIGQYCVISNNDNGMKRIAFQLKGFKNFEIDGNGSLFVFHGNMVPFNLDSAENIALKNITIDWARPFHSQGLVVAVDNIKKTFDIEIDSIYTYHMEKDVICFTGEDWSQDIGFNLFFDPATRATVYDVNRYKLDTWNPLLNTRYGAKELRKGLLRITDTIAVLPQKGWMFITGGGKDPNRQSPAIRIFGSRNISLSDITIHHAGGMGVLGEHSEDITLKHVNVVLPAGSNRLVTTTADATHFVNCRGHIEIDSCLFENMLDDATNIHGIYAKLTRIVNPNTIEIHAVHGQQNLVRFADEGDTIKIYDNETMNETVTLRVKKFRYINERYAEITFDQDISSVKINSAIENFEWYPSFTMRYSTVRNNRARGILIATRKKVLVENCEFLNQMYAAIFMHGDMNFWFESGMVNDVTIQNNYFLNSCTGGGERYQSTIMIDPKFVNIADSDKPFHRNIRIENNTIETFDFPVIDALSVDGMVIRDNKIIRTGTYSPLYPNFPNINIRHCKNVLIEDNQYNGEKAIHIQVDEASKRSCVINQ